MLFAGPVPNATSPCMAGLPPNGISRSEQSNSSSLVFNFKKPAAGAVFHGDGPNAASSKTVKWSLPMKGGPLGRESLPFTSFYDEMALALHVGSLRSTFDQCGGEAADGPRGSRL